MRNTGRHHMGDDLVVSAWVSVRDGCEITCSTESKHGVYFTVTSEDAPAFEFAFQAGALRQLIAAGSKALADLDASTSCCCGES
jgi:hypothetical protein